MQVILRGRPLSTTKHGEGRMSTKNQLTQTDRAMMLQTARFFLKTGCNNGFSHGLRSLCSAEHHDHRKIGVEQELFYFHEYAPGSAFFLPHGTRIINKLQSLLRGHYLRRGYEEVVTPMIFHRDLWKLSGHWDFYQQHMFEVRAPHHGHQEETEKDQDHVMEEAMGLKPMNCPSHCLIYRSRNRSHRELPLRLADFGMLHRNELAGALTGLTRVRRFQQDDAHIFCAEEQMQREIEDCLDMMEGVYRLLGFDYAFTLSTRPGERMGTEDQWDRAEGALAAALDAKGLPFVVNAGDGAFYGPKIDVLVTDKADKKHQLATIQLDFQLPRRFELQYAAADGQLHTPVIVHRAVLGSFERAFALLLETHGGSWPFWLSPRQIAVLPISQRHLPYAQEVMAILRSSGFHAELDDDPVTLPRRIRRAQLARFNSLIILGDTEAQNRTITVRDRNETVAQQQIVFEDLINFFTNQIPEFYKRQ